MPEVISLNKWTKGKELLKAGIEIEVIWLDEDLIELRVHGSNGRFSGTTELYGGHDALTEVADAFQGFPTSIHDNRVHQLGTFDPGCGGGGVRLSLRCIGSWGKAVVEMRIRSEPQTPDGQSECAEFAVPVEPHAIDLFVSRLNGMEVAIGAVARLRGAT